MPPLITPLKQMIANISVITLSLFILSYVGILLFAYIFADKMIFPYNRQPEQDPAGTIKLESALGDSISALYLEARDRPKQIILYNHGNNHDLIEFLPMLEDFQANGFSILCYDYPGYGSSSGSPSEAGVYAAADAAYKYVTQHLGYASESITLYGCSLGSGPASWLAQRYRVGQLILEGGFTSTYRVITKIKLLPTDKFDNLARLPLIKCPVLLIHGMQDEVIPFSHALQNLAAIRSPKDYLWLKYASHNNVVEVAGSRYWDKILNFTESTVPVRIAE